MKKCECGRCSECVIECVSRLANGPHRFAGSPGDLSSASDAREITIKARKDIAKEIVGAIKAKVVRQAFEGKLSAEVRLGDKPSESIDVAVAELRAEGFIVTMGGGPSCEFVTLEW